VDRDLRAAVTRMGRNAYRISKIAKTLGVRLGSHTAKIDHLLQHQYWLASRRAMAGTSTHASTTDGKRFAKRDWNGGLLCNVEKQEFCWMPPVVDDVQAQLMLNARAHLCVMSSALRTCLASSQKSCFDF